MQRFAHFVTAAILAATAAGCAANAPSPTTTAPAGDESSLVAPIERSREVAGQLDQREADLERMVEEMGG